MKIKSQTIRASVIASFMTFISINASAIDPTATHYTADQCLGSSLPYQAPDQVFEYPDTLTPVFINHVGRHGARYPSSAKNIDLVISVFESADSAGALTNDGKKILKIAGKIKKASIGHWGALDSLGIAEQRGIASRMFHAYPQLFKGESISAISSYAPRCIMSMYSFLHQLSRLNNNVEISAGSGRDYSELLRFFDINTDYKEFAEGDAWRQALKDFRDKNIPVESLKKFILPSYTITKNEAGDVTMAIYSMLASSAAMGMPFNMREFFTLEQLNSLWACANMRHYLLYSCNVLSSAPMEDAAQLIQNLIKTIDSTISDIENGKKHSTVDLRFGHAETLMPLLSLMRLKGCYYLTNYFDTVGLHWCDFDIVPMAANIQLKLFRGPQDRFYLRVDLNEYPIPLIPGSESLYISWEEARGYLQRCLPIYFQD